MPSTPNADQREFWAREGEEWVRQAARYDAMNGRFGASVLDAAALRPGEHVLDVGCGNGATSLEAAGRVQPGGSVLGVDISAPMLGLARQRAAEAGLDNATFEEHDAQVHAFEPGAFDVVISRFGVMFFEDPEAAFANLARAVRPGGRLAMVVWEDLLRAEWLIVPGAAVAEHVGFPDMGAPGAPGPFTFADGDRLRTILEGAGFAEITLETITHPMRMGDNIDDVTDFMTSLELVRELFAGKPEDKVATAIAAAREAVKPYESADGVIMNGTAWLVTARR